MPETDQREFSSPACSLNELEQQARDAADIFTIYHNPACSKSRATLALLQAASVKLRVVEYLRTPPSAVELAVIARKLGIPPAQLVRTNEPIYREKYAGKTLSDVEWLRALALDPILLERPIVVHGEAAVIGRPPENVQRLLG